MTDKKKPNTQFVVDASIFPGHVTTNPSAPIMIAAEKAVEKILALATPTTTTSSAAGSATAVPHYSQCGGIVSSFPSLPPSLPLFVS